MSAPGLLVVLRKELKDNLRDRRSLTSGLLVPLLGPVMFTLMFSALAEMTVLAVIGERKSQRRGRRPEDTRQVTLFT